MRREPCGKLQTTLGRTGHPKHSFQLFTTLSTTAVRSRPSPAGVQHFHPALYILWLVGARQSCMRRSASAKAPRGCRAADVDASRSACSILASHASGCTARVTVSSRRWRGCRTAAAPPMHHGLLYCAVVHCCMLRWLIADVREPALYVRRDMHGVRVSCKICRWCMLSCIAGSKCLAAHLPTCSRKA